MPAYFNVVPLTGDRFCNDWHVKKQAWHRIPWGSVGSGSCIKRRGGTWATGSLFYGTGKQGLISYGPGCPTCRPAHITRKNWPRICRRQQDYGLSARRPGIDSVMHACSFGILPENDDLRTQPDTNSPAKQMSNKLLTFVSTIFARLQLHNMLNSRAFRLSLPSQTAGSDGANSPSHLRQCRFPTILLRYAVKPLHGASATAN